MTLHEFNQLPTGELEAALFRCCGSLTWVSKMLPFIPTEDLVELLGEAEKQWFACSHDDWKEAFAQHPKIGDLDAMKAKFAGVTGSVEMGWASGEQSGVANASREAISELANLNAAYEKKFGYIFIVCATGKSAGEMLQLLQARITNTPATEIEIAAEEQNKITRLRIEKLLA